jgi:hypothetical protein
VKDKLSDDLAPMYRSNGQEQVRSRSMNLGHFISPIKGCVEKYMTGFRIDGRTIKRGKLVCISVI